MSFWTKSEAAKEFHVSPTTINNWIIATEKNKINLNLATVGTKTVLVDSEHNRKIIKQLIEKGKKHIGRGGRVVVEVSDKIDKIFTQAQKAELLASLSSRNEIPYKFTYLGNGADLWDQHYRSSVNSENKLISNEYNLILENLEGITYKFKDYETINIVDIGCGNGLPVIPIIHRLIDLGFKIKYTAIDISDRMIEIDKKQLLETFPNLDYTSHIIDLDQTNISEILLNNRNDQNTANLLLYLGGTLGNQTDSGRFFANIRDSMCNDDFLFIGISLVVDEPKPTSYEPNEHHMKRTTWILDMLGLEDQYPKTVLNMYDSLKKETTRRIPILNDITVNFKYKNSVFPLEFDQYEEILVVSYREFKEAEIIQQIVERGFTIEQFLSNRGRSYALILVRPKQV
jgi:uncharacterized SAM-dependent methyltransferase